jgi:anti-sigma factor ChrR (cupin superfamily)
MMMLEALAGALSFDLAAITRDPHRLPWLPFRPGIRIHRAHGTGADGKPSAAFLLYEPGARVPRHTHSGFEHVFVLSGSQIDENGEHGAGSFVVNPPGSSHDVISPGGCLVLVIWEAPIVFEPVNTRS